VITLALVALHPKSHPPITPHRSKDSLLLARDPSSQSVTHTHRCRDTHTHKMSNNADEVMSAASSASTTTMATSTETAGASSSTAAPADDSSPVYSYEVQSLRDALPDALHIHTDRSQLRQKPSATEAPTDEDTGGEEDEAEADGVGSDVSDDEEMERLYEENKDWYGAVVMPCLRRVIAKKKTDLDAFFIEQPRLLLASAQGTGKKIALCEQLKRLKEVATREKKPFRVLWITPSSADYERVEPLLQEHSQLPFDAFLDPHTLVPSSSDEEEERNNKAASDQKQQQRKIFSGAAASFRHMRKRLAKKHKAAAPNWVEEAKQLRRELLERRRERRLQLLKEREAASSASGASSAATSAAREAPNEQHEEEDIGMEDSLAAAVDDSASAAVEGAEEVKEEEANDASALVPSPTPDDIEKQEKQQREQQRKADRDLLLPALFEHDCVLLGMNQFYSWIKFGNRYFSGKNDGQSEQSPSTSAAAPATMATTAAPPAAAVTAPSEETKEDATMVEEETKAVPDATVAPAAAASAPVTTKPAASSTESIRWSIPSFDVIVLDETARTRDAYFRMCDLAQARAEKAKSDPERAALRNIIPLFSTSLKTLAHEARHVWAAEAITTLNMPPGPKVIEFLDDLMPNKKRCFALQNLVAPPRQPRFYEATSLSDWCTSMMLFVLGVKKLDISTQYKPRKNVALPFNANAVGQQRNHVLVLTDDDEQTWDLLEARLQYKQERLSPYVFPFDPELPAFQQKAKAFHAIFLRCRRVASIHILTKHAMRFAAQDIVVPILYLWCDEVEEHANMTRKQKDVKQKQQQQRR
jgi:hypothetical protein